MLLYLQNMAFSHKMACFNKQRAITPEGMRHIWTDIEQDTIHFGSISSTPLLGQDNEN